MADGAIRRDHSPWSLHHRNREPLFLSAETWAVMASQFEAAPVPRFEEYARLKRLSPPELTGIVRSTSRLSYCASH